MAQERVYLGDTAVLEAYLYDEDGVTPLDASSVSWTIKRPDGTTVNGGPIAIDDSSVDVTTNETSQTGLYAVQIQFTLPNNNKKSIAKTYEVVDPLQVTGSASTDEEAAIDRAWMKLEDCFDSEELGGPYLREATLQIFDREKMARLLPDAIYNINSTYQPQTFYTPNTFPYISDGPLVSEALLIETIYHLMRSYVEQPLPAGAPVNYFDRRDYVQRWQSVLQVEEPKFLRWLDMFKRAQMGYGQTAILVGGYSRSYYLPRFMRSRYPYIPTRY